MSKIYGINCNLKIFIILTKDNDLSIQFTVTNN